MFLDRPAPIWLVGADTCGNGFEDRSHPIGRRPQPIQEPRRVADRQPVVEGAVNQRFTDRNVSPGARGTKQKKRARSKNVHLRNAEPLVASA